MSQTSKVISEAFAGTRLTFESNKPFDEVMSNLYASIGSPAGLGKWQAIAQGIKSYSDEAREAFTSAINKIVGPHDFMLFQVNSSCHQNRTFLIENLGVQSRRLGSSFRCRRRSQSEENHPRQSSNCNHDVEERYDCWSLCPGRDFGDGKGEEWWHGGDLYASELLDYGFE